MDVAHRLSACAAPVSSDVHRGANRWLLASTRCSVQSWFITIDVPGADETQALAINSTTKIVGSYKVNGRSHAFLLVNGSFTTVDPPAATSASTWAFSGSNDPAS